MNSPDPPRSLSIRVPASTSNLGPGFDCLGLALDLFLDVRLTGPKREAEHDRTLAGPSTASWPSASEDLTIRAFERACEALGVAATHWSWQIESEIPIGRGLGSSGAAVAAGIRLAGALAPEPPTLARELALGIELEGHPDNVAASLIGGATLCVPIEGQQPACTPLELSPELGFALAWPLEPLTTSAAREALPSSVLFSDALENPRRLGLLLAGLRNADARLLTLGGEDRLHERYRLPLIPGAEAALAAGRAAGAWLASLSGSGSALFAICPKPTAERVAEAMRAELERARPGAVARTAHAVREGARVREVTG